MAKKKIKKPARKRSAKKSLSGPLPETAANKIEVLRILIAGHENIIDNLSDRVVGLEARIAELHAWRNNIADPTLCDVEPLRHKTDGIQATLERTIERVARLGAPEEQPNQEPLPGIEG